MKALIILLALASLAAANPCAVGTFPAADVRVIDGDTVEATLVLPLRTARREGFRLARIDDGQSVNDWLVANGYARTYP
jgi:endonuclease YncB( thermonuclease family)